jgi:SPP1 gp7 family putative phage head morphogenesis protein
MSSNQYLVDRITREQLLLQRYSNSVIRELLPILTNLRNSLEVRMMQTPTEFQAMRLAGLQADLSRIITEITGQLEIQLSDSLTELAQYQAEFAAKALQTAVSVETVLPSVDQIAAVVTRSQMKLVSGNQIKNLTLNQLITEFAGSMDRQIKTAIQAGVIEGRTVQELAREVGGLVNTRSRRQAETLVRTAVNHVGSVARQRTYEANADVIAGERYVSVMDSRVTQTCAGFADQLFPIGQGPMPPQHYGCRSVRVPEVKPEFRIPGIEGERATVKGPVNARKTFDGWLRDQPSDFQKEYFFKFPEGEERYKLFRDGVKLKQFTDAQGVALSIDELKAREGLALA